MQFGSAIGAAFLIFLLLFKEVIVIMKHVPRDVIISFIIFSGIFVIANVFYIIGIRPFNVNYLMYMIYYALPISLFSGVEFLLCLSSKKKRTRLMFVYLIFIIAAVMLYWENYIGGISGVGRFLTVLFTWLASIGIGAFLAYLYAVRNGKDFSCEKDENEAMLEGRIIIALSLIISALIIANSFYDIGDSIRDIGNSIRDLRRAIYAILDAR